MSSNTQNAIVSFGGNVLMIGRILFRDYREYCVGAVPNDWLYLGDARSISGRDIS